MTENQPNTSYPEYWDDDDDDDYDYGHENYEQRIEWENPSQVNLNQFLCEHASSIDASTQELIVKSYLEWEHISAISLKVHQPESTVASILNMRGVSFYCDEGVYQPWPEWVVKSDEPNHIEYIKCKSATPTPYSYDQISVEGLLASENTTHNEHDSYIFADRLHQTDKRRFIRFITGFFGLDKGLNLATRLRDFRVVYFIALQRRDVMGALEALNAQAMTLNPSFTEARHMLQSYLGFNIINELSRMYREWQSLCNDGKTTLNALDRPDLKDQESLLRTIAACLPASDSLPEFVQVAISLGERNHQSLEYFAQRGDLLSKFYCVDRSIKAINCGDPYRCDIDWAHDIQNWRLEDYCFDERLNRYFSFNMRNLANNLTQRLSRPYDEPWKASNKSGFLDYDLAP